MAAGTPQPKLTGAAGEKQTNEDAVNAFATGGASDALDTRAALAAFGSPVLVLAGRLERAALIYQLRREAPTGRSRAPSTLTWKLSAPAMTTVRPGL